MLVRINTHSEAIFDFSYFMENPDPFYELARELIPGSFEPTASHHFIRVLQDNGILLRNYTQNIDMLERIAGIDEKLLVESHGSFSTSRCVGRINTKPCVESDASDHQIITKSCGKTYTLLEFKEHLATGIPICTCGGLIKPNITFFGEKLPARFHSLIERDFDTCDALIVIGTSLQVLPFSALIGKVRSHVPRLLINFEEAGVGQEGGFDFETCERDFIFRGDCNAGVKRLSDLMGWGDVLEKLCVEKAGLGGLKDDWVVVSDDSIAGVLEPPVSLKAGDASSDSPEPKAQPSVSSNSVEKESDPLEPKAPLEDPTKELTSLLVKVKL